MNSMRSTIIIFLLFHSAINQAQTVNIVPNWNFENYSVCPFSYSLIYLATPWNTGDDIGTPDYFNTCSNDVAGVPFNFVGSQMPHSGKAYAGIYTYSGGNPGFKEYLSVPLLQPAIAGQPYVFRMYVSLAGSSSYATDRLGVMLSDDNSVISLTPQYECPVVINDTTNWIKVEAVITPTIDCRYLYIGVFRDVGDYTVQFLSANTANSAYYYIDDVELLSNKFKEHFTREISVCDTSSATLSPDAAVSNGLIWNTGANAPAITVNAAGQYIATLNNGNISINDTFNVSIRNCRYIEHFTKDTFACEDEPTLLSPYKNDLPKYNWSTGDTTASILVNSSGRYIVSYFSSPAIINDTFNVTIKDCMVALKGKLAIPSAFSPNGDGTNDFFKPFHRPMDILSNYDMRIYDRTGNLVFRTTYPDIGWDGTVNGRKQHSGTYIYDIRYTWQGKLKTYKGFVVITI